MISKVKCGATSAFVACCNYDLKEGKQAQIIASQGVRHDAVSMANDFIAYAEQRPEKTKSVLFHGILSFPHEQTGITEDIARKISIEYLNRNGFQDSAYAIISHSDRSHFHLHCISSFIDMNGKIVDDSWIGLRAKKVAQSLTKEYGLIPATKKNFSKTNFENLRDHDKEKYRLHVIISNALKISQSMNQFEDLLRTKNIEIQYKTKRGSYEIQGISFKSGEYCYKGSEIDRDFSYNKILHSIEINDSHNVSSSKSIESKAEHASSILQDFISTIGSSIGGYGGGLLTVNSPNPNQEDDDDIIKKKKKKHKSNEMNL